MTHNNTHNGGHYSVSLEAENRGILVQIMEGRETSHTQAREILTPDEAIHLSDLLRNAVEQHLAMRMQKTFGTPESGSDSYSDY
jgi:hypothetical protein